MTKREYFETWREMVVANEDMDQELAEGMIAFIDNEIALLDKRKESAAKRAAKKKEEGDELTETIFALIPDDAFITADELVAAVGGDVSKNKVTARVGKLVRAGRVVKGDVKIDGTKKVAYSVAPATDETEDTETEE